MSLLRRASYSYTGYLDKWLKYPVIILWIVATGLSAWRGFDFLDNTTPDAGDLPDSAPSYQADLRIFTTPMASLDAAIVTIQLPEPSDVSRPLPPMVNTRAVRPIITFIVEEAQRTLLRHRFTLIETPNVTYAQEEDLIIHYEQDRRVSHVSEDQKTMMIVIRNSDYHDMVNFITSLQQNMTDQVSKHIPGYIVTITGDDAIWEPVLDSLEHDLVLGDGISIPTALLILCFTLRSLRLVVLPIISVACSVLLSFALMLPISESPKQSVSSVAPNLMMSFSIALSVDYTLFIFSRFREEVRRGHTVMTGMAEVLYTAGHTVVVSGATLVICSTALLLLPLDLLASLGIGASISVLCTMLVNLTLVPAIVLTFKGYFLKPTQPWPCSKRPRSNTNDRIAVILPHVTASSISRDEGQGTSIPLHRSRQPEGDEFSVSSTSSELHQESSLALSGMPSGIHSSYSDSDSDSDAEVASLLTRRHVAAAMVEPTTISIEESITKVMKSPWFRFGLRVTKRPWLTIVLITAISAGFFYPALNFRHAGGIICECPQNDPVFQGYETINDQFGGGYMIPFALFVEAQSEEESLTQEHFDTVNGFVRAISEASPELIPLRSVEGMTFSNGNPVNFTKFSHCLAVTEQCTNLLKITEDCYGSCVSQLAFRSQSPTANGSMTLLNINAMTWSGAGMEWVGDAREALEAHAREVDHVAFLGKGSAEEVDIADSLFSKFPTVIGVVAGVVLVLMLIAFRSVTIAIKAVVSIAITQGLVYGFTTLVYQHGILGWTGVRALQSMGAVCWIPTILAFSILVGLGLDYHVFLLSRVVEYRKLGFSDKESVVLGLARTGRVITAAGVIMAIAFLGLLFSHAAVVQQLAMYIVFAVLVDTFVIRACLVPAMMTVIGRFNWWPLTMPPVTRTTAQCVRAQELREGAVRGNITFLD
eukprot:m.12510 g.12510  ORF g.12510 m.12510 type:complete len:933 (+) comp5831_c0_seq2:216-3014(+)